MAKLNNSGWGVSNLITFLVIFILFLLVVAYLIYSVDHEKGSNIQLLNEEFVIFQ